MERAIKEAGLLTTMTLDSGIDIIFAADDPQYVFEAQETVVIEGEIMGSKGAVFLGRAPTPREYWRILFGPGEMTPISDHPGFMSTVHIKPAD